jgi:4'-phosphopantetheinyl transferase
MTETKVDVYWMDLDGPSVESMRFAAMLDSHEHARAKRFRFTEDRRRFVVRRGRLRELLSYYLECSPLQIRFSYNSFGKPAVDFADLRFNISHSHGIALYTIARGVEVGCDIERCDERFADERIAERFFSPREVLALRSLGRAAQIEGFFNCWTRKEAFVKARGQGLSLPLDSFEVSLAPGEPAAFLRGCDGWSIRSFKPAARYHAAVVAEGSVWELNLPPPRRMRSG